MSKSKRRTFCGTLDYLAPEMLTDTYDARVDVWSLGVILYRMACNKFPFDGNNLAQLALTPGPPPTINATSLIMAVSRRCPTG